VGFDVQQAPTTGTTVQQQGVGVGGWQEVRMIEGVRHDIHVARFRNVSALDWMKHARLAQHASCLLQT
jgi:hypothetical protein